MLPFTIKKKPEQKEKDLFVECAFQQRHFLDVFHCLNTFNVVDENLCLKGRKTIKDLKK